MGLFSPPNYLFIIEKQVLFNTLFFSTYINQQQAINSYCFSFALLKKLT